MTLIYKVAYWAGVISQIVIRFPYQNTVKDGGVDPKREGGWGIGGRARTHAIIK